MNKIIQHAEPALKDLRDAMKIHGTAWPMDNGHGHYDFDKAGDVSDMFSNASYFSAVDYSKNMRYTMAAFVALAALDVENNKVIADDDNAAEDISVAIDALSDVLPSNKVFILSADLAEAAVYGGTWCDDVMDGWHGIEKLDLNAAEDGYGQTVVVLVNDRVRHVSLDYVDAQQAVRADDQDSNKVGVEDEDEDKVEYGLLPPNFWTAARHARLCRCG